MVILNSAFLHIGAPLFFNLRHMIRHAPEHLFDITLIYVHLPVPSPRARAWLGQEVLDQYYSEEAEEALAGARAAIAARGLKAGEIKRVGDPGAEIAKAATEGGSVLIVMGTHGRSALGTLVMGSVATKVLAHSSVPVLLVK